MILDCISPRGSIAVARHRSGVSTWVDHVVRQAVGLACRATDPRDRRSVLVARRPAGAAHVAALRRLIQAVARANGIEVNAAADVPTTLAA